MQLHIDSVALLKDNIGACVAKVNLVTQALCYKGGSMGWLLVVAWIAIAILCIAIGNKKQIGLLVGIGGVMFLLAACLEIVV